MPITQSRMITIISAAADYQKAFTIFLAKIDKIAELWKAGAISSEDAMAQVFVFSTPPQRHALLLQNPESPGIVYAELKHYRLNSRRNDKSRRKAAELRRESGTTPRAPSSSPFRVISAPLTAEPSIPAPQPSQAAQTETRGSTKLAVEYLAKYEREQRQAELTSFEMEQAKLAASPDDEVFDPTLLDSGPPAISLRPSAEKRPTKDSPPDD